MRDQIHLHEPGRRIIPAIESANRHAAPDPGRGCRTPTRASCRLLFNLAQCPINGCSAHRHQTVTHFRCKLEMTVPFHRFHQDRHQWPQPLAAHTIRGFPDDDQRVSDGLTIYPPRRTRTGALARLPGAKKTHRVLAVEPTHRHEFVQDTAAMLSAARCVAPGQRNHQLVSCRHADLPHFRSRRCDTVGSISNEATLRNVGAFLDEAMRCSASW